MRTLRIVCILLAAIGWFTLEAGASSLAIKPELAFRKAFPTVKVDSFGESPIKGAYEVVSGQEVLYFFPEEDLLMNGYIYTKDGRNLTGEKKQELKAKVQAEALKKLKDLPLEKAVKVGHGAKTVIEFTDPDCPYCRRAAEALNKRTDITRFVFFTPLAHPNAITKVYYILSAKDQEKAYHEMMAGKPLPATTAEYSKEVKDLAAEYLTIAKSLAIEGTPTFFINGQQVVGADIERINKLLQ